MIASVRLSTSLSDGGVATWVSPVVKTTPEGFVWVKIPRRVRGIPFPPYGGRKFVLLDPKHLHPSSLAHAGPATRR